MDPNLPTINITGPSDGALVSQDNVVVTGVLNDAVTTVSYTVNGGRSWPVEFADNEYAFPLRDFVAGENTVAVTVGNADGDTDVTSFTVRYDPDSADEMADTFYVSNNGPDNVGEVDTFDEGFELQSTFNAGNNEGVELDRLGSLYQAGDTTSGPSIRIVAQIHDRENGAFDPARDREIKGDQTGLVAPKGIDLAEESRYIIVADFGADPDSDNLKVFGTDDDGNTAPVGTTDLAVKPWDVAYDEASDRLFVAQTDGTVAVFDSYTDGFGENGPDRTLTPVDRRNVQASDNLHGVAYNADLDALVVADVGAATTPDQDGFGTDGGIYVIHDASEQDGNVRPGRSIFGPATMLGNPVDLILNGTEARVTEKAQGKLLVFENIFFGRSGDVAPDLAADESGPESIVASPENFDDPDDPDGGKGGFDSDFDLSLYVSNNGPDNVGNVDTFDEAFRLQRTY